MTNGVLLGTGVTPTAGMLPKIAGGVPLGPAVATTTVWAGMTNVAGAVVGDGITNGVLVAVAIAVPAARPPSTVIEIEPAKPDGTPMSPAVSTSISLAARDMVRVSSVPPPRRRTRMVTSVAVVAVCRSATLDVIPLASLLNMGENSAQFVESLGGTV